MKLFVMYLGGTHKKALVEVHDIRIIAAEKLEDTYDEIRKSWWGTPESLHIDVWGVLEYADGYKINLKDKPSESDHKLYFVNLGGYDENDFTELHKNVFVVATSPSKAKVRGLKQILDWNSHHRDYQFDIDNILDLRETALVKNLYIHLEPTEESKKFKFESKHISLGK